ncbi:hypothetical protein LINGRAHAP2_LOCUS3964 [Linum grandiflorum]
MKENAKSTNSCSSMSYPLKIGNSSCCASTGLPSSSFFNPLAPSSLPISTSRFSRRIYLHKSSSYSSIRLLSPPLLCSVNAYDSPDSQNSSNHQGSVQKDETHQGSFSSKEILKRLQRYGVAGVLSYGLLNTAYYLTTFLFVWLYVAPAPGKMGFSAAAQRFLKVMAMVWAGSQVTKVFRAGGALALAPFVDKGLSWFTTKFEFETQGKAFGAIAGACFGLAILLFLVVTLLWA